MYSHVACDVMKERTLYLLKPSSLIWHLMPYLFLFIARAITVGPSNLPYPTDTKKRKGGIEHSNPTANFAVGSEFTIYWLVHLVLLFTPLMFIRI